MDENAPGDKADDSAATALIQAFADFVRSAASDERTAAAGAEPLLSIADAARYLSVSTTTVRNLAVGGKVRSMRVGDRIRFRRTWLDEWIDAGGGEVPVPPPTPKPSAPDRAAPRPSVRPIRRRAELRPKPPTYIQRVGDQELRLLSDQAGGRGATTWHVGVRTPLCEASGRWASALKRWPRGFMCKPCLSALVALPEADLERFDIGRVYMMRLTLRGETATVIRAGYHAGDGRKTLCGKKDGPWALTEREPRTKQCFVCDHRRRWDARDDDPNILSPRPVTPMKVLVDAGPLDPRLVEILGAHPESLDARHAMEPLDDDAIWTNKWHDLHHRAEPIGRFTGPPGPLTSQPDRWLEWTISDRLGFGLDVDDALKRMPGWANDVERATALYARWAKEPGGRKAR
jgi:excisionase family DNA binding protein